MSRSPRLSILLLVLYRTGAAALELEGGLTHEELTDDKPDWDSAYLEGAHDFAPRRTLYGVVRETERFDLRDTELAAAYYHPFGTTWTAQIEASASPDHNVLPEASVLGQLTWGFGEGWLLNGGARFSEYTDTSTRLLMAGIERYFGSYRVAYTVTNGKPEGASSAPSHRVALDHYYNNERSRIGFSVAWGSEVENVGPPTGVLVTEIRAIAVVGRHWVTPKWALAWEVGTHEQGDFYRRTGGRLGLRYSF